MVQQSFVVSFYCNVCGAGNAVEDFAGEPATCIRDTTEPKAVKFFTNDPKVVAAAKAAQKANKEIVILWIAKAIGDNVCQWATGTRA